jgi:hypothetical protein
MMNAIKAHRHQVIPAALILAALSTLLIPGTVDAVLQVPATAWNSITTAWGWIATVWNWIF